MLTIRIGTALEEVNRRVLEATLIECDNVKRKAAKMLGISLKTLYNRLAVYNMNKDGDSAEGKENGDDDDGDDDFRA